MHDVRNEANVVVNIEDHKSCTYVHLVRGLLVVHIVEGVAGVPGGDQADLEGEEGRVDKC